MRNTATLALTAVAIFGVTSCSSIRNATDSIASGAKNLVSSDDEYKYNTARFVINVSGSDRVVDIALMPDVAPNHVANFKKLVHEGYYEGLAVHRAIPNYLVQTGDPRSRRTDARSIWGLGGPGYTIPAETGAKHKRGSVAMARLGNNVNPARESNGSQFYVSLKSIPSLDGEYTVFGEVVSGLDVITNISKVNTDDNDVPNANIIITRTELVPGNTPISDEVLTAQTNDRPEDEISDSELEREIAANPSSINNRRSTPTKRSLFGEILHRIW